MMSNSDAQDLNNSGATNLSNTIRPIIAGGSISVGDSMQMFQINCHKSINSNLTLAFHSQNYD